MSSIFHAVIYQPLYNVLIFFYNSIPGHDFGLAIIVTTVLLKAVLIPLYNKQLSAQKKLQELQPKIKEIQKKHKDNKEQQTKELMEFYKANQANPFGGCLPLIIQLVFLIAIYRILFNISKAGLNVEPADLYSFVQNPGQINNMFIGLVDLSKPNYILAGLAAIAQYFQIKTLTAKKKPTTAPAKPGEPDMAEMMNKQMLIIGPVMTIIIGIRFPAGLALYWLVSTLFMILQQKYYSQTEPATETQVDKK